MDNYFNLTFDREIDAIKSQMRKDRWKEVFNFQRKPSRSQKKILLEELKICAVSYSLLAIVIIAMAS